MNYPSLISHTWLGMLALLITMLMVDVLSHAMRGDYKELSEALAKDPGPTGLRVLVCMICFNALIQALVHTSSAGPFRLTILVLSVLYTAFFVAHQIVHLFGGEKPGLHSILDLTHHALGFLAIWAAWQWIGAV